MTYLCLVGATGAPGVTTTAAAILLTCPGPALLVEADTAGSALTPGLLQAGAAAGRGLLGLAVAARRGELAELVDEYTTAVDRSGARRVLPGVLTPEQVPAVAGVWEPLARQLRYRGLRGEYIVVDAGRLPGAGTPAWPLLRVAQQVVVVARATLPGVASARVTLRLLQAQLPGLATDEQRVGVLLVGDPDPYTSSEVRSALGVPVLGQIPADPRAARVLHLGAPPFRGFDRSPLLRAARTVALDLQQPALDDDVEVVA